MQRGMGLAAMVIVMAGVLAGCRSVVMVGAGSAVGEGSVAYVRGELQAVRRESVTDCYQASLKAMKDLQLRVVKQAGDVFSGVVEAREADGAPVYIHIERQEDGTTLVGIRTGVLGDESKSQVVLSKIRRHL